MKSLFNTSKYYSITYYLITQDKVLSGIQTLFLESKEKLSVGNLTAALASKYFPNYMPIIVSVLNISKTDFEMLNSLQEKFNEIQERFYQDTESQAILDTETGEVSS